ncbi:endo alpha-1,4 polygalactosaminidase precursor [Phlyctema vagabunda]|uniref:alpha-galactosidase n=1 Tax=Phlyctema vagabunda TaxID=108571 RepID=A0ABR4PVC2_9HELO
MAPSMSASKITATLLAVLATFPSLTASVSIGSFQNRSLPIWAPTTGTTWQIVLNADNVDASVRVQAIDVDVFDNTAAKIASLKKSGKKVICYFSAGSYEDWRSDAGSFVDDDLGDELDGWPGEYWLDTNSANVRKVMATRMDLAVKKGCDAIDPDNVDAYDNDGGGLGLDEDDATSYTTFLAATAHSKGLAIGLKNAGDIITPGLVAKFDFAINEQCLVYNECATWQPFLDAKKPIFHIEYPSTAPKVSAAAKKKICSNASRKSFSTVLKLEALDNWMLTC